jgi:hypothetical protein
VLLEKTEEYFDLKEESPYMLIVSDVAEAKREKPLKDRKGIEKIKEKLSEIPAVTHVDHSARVQTVKREDNPYFYDLIRKFCEDHGCPVVVNTSFNVRGEPIVCTPEDACRCFSGTDMDYLAIGSYLIGKKDNNMTGFRKKINYAEKQPVALNGERRVKGISGKILFWFRKLIAFLVYFFMILPAGLISKILRKDILDKKPRGEGSTYWKRRKRAAADRKSLVKQY